MKTIIDIQEVSKLYNEGHSILDLSIKYKVSHMTMKRRMIENGILIRTQSQQKLITMNKDIVKKRISDGSKRSQPKRKITNIKKYGHEVASNGINWKDTYEEKNGVRHPNQKKEFIDKMSGDNNPSKRKESRLKIKQNRWIEKTNNELNEIKNKSKQTWINNTGKDNPMKIIENVNKVRKTINEKLGVDWITKDKDIKNKIRETHLIKMKSKIIERLKFLNLELVEDFITVSLPINLKCTKCGNIFETVLDYVFHDYGICRKCYPINVSSNERELREFISEILPNNEIIYNDRKILNGKEIDIYIPSKNIGIEHDGIFIHSENFGISSSYHLFKTEECISKKIKLIHIFEDEWHYKKDIVKSRLKRILKVDTLPKIYARKCIIKEIDSNTKNEFLEKFHIQGKDISSIRLGAFYDDELISVMTFSKGNISKGSSSKEGVWELNRFCSNYNYSIPGVASKLLSHFKKNYNWFEIFSYCDRRWSDGNVYYKLGFVLDSITKPNYWYTKSLKRIHRFNLRKTIKDPKNIPEWILRRNEGYYRIWDCGNFKFKIYKETY